MWPLQQRHIFPCRHKQCHLNWADSQCSLNASPIVIPDAQCLLISTHLFGKLHNSYLSGSVKFYIVYTFFKTCATWKTHLFNLLLLLSHWACMSLRVKHYQPISITCMNLCSLLPNVPIIDSREIGLPISYWDHCQICFLRLLAMDCIGIAEMQTHDLQGLLC